MAKYYYIDNNEQQAGPVQADELIQLGVTPDTYVWREGMSNWEKASTLVELAPFLAVNTPPPFQPTPPAQHKGRPTEHYNTKQTEYTNTENKYEPCPDNNLVLAIVSTILCCWPLGLVAIIQATKVERLWNTGHKEEAKAKAEEARNWAIASIVTCIIGFILYFLFLILYTTIQ